MMKKWNTIAECRPQIHHPPRRSSRKHYAIVARRTSHSNLNGTSKQPSTHGTFTPRDNSLSLRECAWKPLNDIVGAEMDAKELRRRQKSNQAVARCIPVFLICAVIYASWVFVGPLCGE
jgi:hypothetical protein